MAPFDWRDLVADFGLGGQLMVTLGVKTSIEWFDRPPLGEFSPRG